MQVRSEEIPASPVEAPAPSTARRATAALRYRNYRLLWMGTLATATGQWMQQVAMGWLALTLTNSAFWVGAVGFSRGIPMLLFSLVGGVLADRMDRRKLLLVMQASAGAIAALLALMIYTGHATIGVLLIFSFLSGSALAIIFPTRQALVPGLVEREDLPNAVAVNSATMNGSRIMGPALAGLLLGAVGVVACFAFQAAGFVWAFFMSSRVRLPERPIAARRVSAWRSLQDGFAYIRSDARIMALLALAAVPTVFGMPYMQMLPVMARDVLGTGPEGLGLLMGASGTGALSGSLTIAVLGNIRHKGRWLLAAAATFGALLAIFATARSLPVAMGLLAVAGIAQSIYMALNNTLLHSIVPDEFRGRVMSVYMLTWGLMPLGTLPIGYIAQVAGAPVAIAVGGGICAVFSLLTAATRPVLRDLP